MQQHYEGTTEVGRDMHEVMRKLFLRKDVLSVPRFASFIGYAPHEKALGGNGALLSNWSSSFLNMFPIDIEYPDPREVTLFDYDQNAHLLVVSIQRRDRKRRGLGRLWHFFEYENPSSLVA